MSLLGSEGIQPDLPVFIALLLSARQRDGTQRDSPSRLSVILHKERKCEQVTVNGIKLRLAEGGGCKKEGGGQGPLEGSHRRCVLCWFTYPKLCCSQCSSPDSFASSQLSECGQPHSCFPPAQDPCCRIYLARKGCSPAPSCENTRGLVQELLHTHFHNRTRPCQLDATFW